MKIASLLVRFAAATAVVASTVITDQDIMRFAKYSDIAYCPRLWDGRINSRVCPTDLWCAELKGAVTVFEQRPASIFRIGSHGYKIAANVATDKDNKMIVVTYRGTATLSDLVKDILFFQTDVPHICKGCKVHTGFKDAYDGNDKILKAVQDEKAKAGQSDYRVVITGHSLGGAVATVAGAHFRRLATPIDCDIFTYGSPRVGNPEFATNVSQHSSITARITKGKDIITDVPAKELLFSYAHTYPQTWFPSSIGTGKKTCSQSNEETCGSTACWDKQGNRLDACRLRALEVYRRSSDHSRYAGDPFYRAVCADREGRAIEPQPDIEFTEHELMEIARNASSAACGTGKKACRSECIPSTETCRPPTAEMAEAAYANNAGAGSSRRCKPDQERDAYSE